MSKIIVILGPTASGKTSLSIKLALQLRSGLTKKGYRGIEIVSADSRQIYKHLRIGSGVVTKKEMQGVRHHLIEFLDPKKIFSAGAFQKLAQQKIKEIGGRGCLPFIVGGTGFYIDVVTQRVNLPQIKANKKLRYQLEKKTTKQLIEILKKLEPERLKTIDKNNPRRLIRAIEIESKKQKIENSIDPKTQIPNPGFKTQHKVLYIGVKKNQKQLKQDIETRFVQWLEAGFFKELEKLIKLNVSPKRFKEFGLHYWYGYLFLKNKIDFEDFYKKSIFSLWHYAKRQLTWFKKNKKIHWINQSTNGEKQAKILIKNFIEK